MKELPPSKYRPPDPSDCTPLYPTNVRRRFLLPKGECQYCDRERASREAAGKDPETSFMPPHDASTNCESGKHSHCTCDTCF